MYMYMYIYMYTCTHHYLQYMYIPSLLFLPIIFLSPTPSTFPLPPAPPSILPLSSLPPSIPLFFPPSALPLFLTHPGGAGLWLQDADWTGCGGGHSLPPPTGTAPSGHQAQERLGKWRMRVISDLCRQFVKGEGLRLGLR